jgi:hypothetical protein
VLWSFSLQPHSYVYTIVVLSKLISILPTYIALWFFFHIFMKNSLLRLTNFLVWSSSVYDFFQKKSISTFIMCKTIMSHTYHWHTWLVILMVNRTSCMVGKRQRWETSKVLSQIPPWIPLNITLMRPCLKLGSQVRTRLRIDHLKIHFWKKINWYVIRVLIRKVRVFGSKV